FAFGGLATVSFWQRSIDQREDLRYQSREESVEARQQLGLPGDDQLGAAADGCMDNLTRGTTSGHCIERGVRSHAKPAKFRLMSAFEVSIEIRAGTHEAGNDGSD